MPCDPTAAFTGYRPVSLASMDATANLQTRRDNKYIVPADLFLEWQRSLQATHRALDIAGRRVFTYDTQYFDTPSLDLYRAHVQGRRKRFKARSRHYVDSGLCFFEVKLKSGRGETIKKKVPYDARCLDVVTRQAEAFVQHHLNTHYAAELDAPLVPTLRTHYRRATLVAEQSTERITCDFDLMFQRDADSLAGMRPGYVLVEIKTAQGRGGSDRLLWGMGVRPMGGSKYCTGIGMLWPDQTGNAFQRQIRRYYCSADSWSGTARPAAHAHAHAI